MERDLTQIEMALSVDDYAALAAFRYELRRFLDFSERAAAAHGLPAQQHQALLTIAGHLGSDAPTVGLIAQQLLITPSSAVELVSRMVAAGLLKKQQGTADRRRAELRLTERAEALLCELSAVHIEELKVMEPALARALRRLGRQDNLRI